METVRFDYLVSDFYAVETMYQTLAHPRKVLLYPEFYCKHVDDDMYPINIEVNRLWKEMDEYRKENHPPMARMLRDSLLGMAIGESRHHTEVDRYQGGYAMDDDAGVLHSSHSRQTVYNNLHRFSVEDVHQVEEVFNDDGWCDSFGGYHWAEITRYVQKYGTVDDTTFIDIVVHAVHNGGCAFDKGLLVMVNNTSLCQSILDSKFQGSILDLHYVNVSRKVEGWIKRYKRIMELMNTPINVPEEIHVHDEYEYSMIEWNDTDEYTIELDYDENRHENYCHECDDYNCGCNDYEHDDTNGLAYVSLQTIQNNIKEKEYEKKQQKQKQEQAKKQGKDFDYKTAKALTPMSLR